MSAPDNEQRPRKEGEGAAESFGGDNSMLLAPTHTRVEVEAVRHAWAAH